MKWPQRGRWPLAVVALTTLAFGTLGNFLFPETKAVAHKQVVPVLPHAKELPGLVLERMDAPQAASAVIENAFNSMSWYEPPPPPPPPPVALEKPAAPTAPPVPFTYFGRYENPPKKIVMLTRNEQLYTVSEGDVIDETYRVEHVSDGAVSLVYLPLGTVQSISMNQTTGTK